MSLTLDEAKALKPGDILHNASGQRWRVNGRVKTWKRNPARVYVPLKHGLYTYDHLTEGDFDPDGICQMVTKGEPNG